MNDIKLLTWKDVERVLFLKKDDWDRNGITGIEAYPQNVTVYYDDSDEDGESTVIRFLAEVFGTTFIKDKNVIQTRIDKGVGVELCPADEKNKDEGSRIPLFRDVIFEKNAYSIKILNEKLPGVPVIAFHSYKGGVGRTLSLLAYAKAWTNTHLDNQKLLIVDSDLEAPGITWLMEEEGNLSQTATSYLDFLDLLNESNDVDATADNVADSLKTSVMKIEDSNKQIEHYVMPVYRYNIQLFDLYTKPENVVFGEGKEYAIADVFSIIGKKLNVGAVLVDLRAGISEYSAPLLLDPRVGRYIVTTTSDQSVMGTCLLLGQVNKGIKLTENSQSPEVLISMVQKVADIGGIKDRIIDEYEFDEDDEGKNDIASLADGIITPLMYDSKFIHLGNWNDIMCKLDGTEFYNTIKQIVGERHPDRSEKKKTLSVSTRQDVIKRLHDFTSDQITAEGNAKFEMLMTTPISSLIRDFRDSIPSAVVMGAKGSGKTFLYREMIRNKTWKGFLDYVEPQGQHPDSNTYFLSIVESSNAVNFIEYNKACRLELGQRIGSAVNVDSLEIKDAIKKAAKTVKGEKEARDFWGQICLSPFKGAFASLQELDEQLKANNTKIVYVADGLEEILQDVHVEENSRRLVRGLIQSLVEYIRSSLTNIGCILYMRSDMIQDAIKVNVDQFISVYKNYALKWSQNEALRLAAWVCNKAAPDTFEFSQGVTGADASESQVRKVLELLWGKKLGKDDSNEAYSSRWILAALSDFNAQLQARDMIRFIQYATEDSGKDSYADRIIMPTEIRKAVPKCSSKKVEELEMERPALKEIFNKMNCRDQSQKVLPLTRGEFGILAEEEEVLRKEGFLIESNNNWYLPEIIRHALGYRYTKGARPKVLSLLIK